MSKKDPISIGDVLGGAAPKASDRIEEIKVSNPTGEEFVIKHPRHMSLFIYLAIFRGLPITFLREFCFYAINLLKVQQVIVVPAVSSCTFMEISNRDSQGWRTACAVAHMTNVQPREPDSLRASIKLLIESLHEQGGNIETAKIQLFGGISELDDDQQVSYKAERANIIKEIRAYCEENNLNAPSIAEPKNHWIKKLPKGQTWKQVCLARANDSLDYILTRFGLWFRRANISQDPASDLISCDHPKGTSPGRRELFCRIMDHPENQEPTSKTMLQTTSLRESWKHLGLLAIPQVLPVNQSGLLFRDTAEKKAPKASSAAPVLESTK